MTVYQPHSAANDQWIWRRADGYRALARFASITAIQGLDLQDREAYQALLAMVASPGADTPTAVRAITERSYDRLRSRRYPYAAPWIYHNGEQFIRDPVAVHQEAGTCLDLSLLFAAMLAGVGLSVFIVVLEGHRYHGDHALVLVDLANTPRGIGSPGDQGSNLPPPVGPEEFSGVRGVWQLAQDSSPVVLAENALAIEVTAACGDPSADFDQACRRGAEKITDRSYQEVHLIDVLACHAQDGDAPLPADRPALYPSLPPMPPFTPYDSRAVVTDELRGATGTIVLLGDSGTGKSMLAHHVAATVAHGAGWFLDASTEQALTVALATQEAQLKGLSAETVDGDTMNVLARAALDRLHQSVGPWAVILDNANEGPQQLKSLPRPTAERGQLLIITTTEDKWADGRDQVKRLDSLRNDEVADAIKTADLPVKAIAGRPLLVDASRRFHEATGRWWWTGQSATADSAPEAVWTAAAAELGQRPARTLAWAISWLPPVRIPAPALTCIAGPDTRSAIARLRDLGLIDAEGDELTMHRLFRTAVRESALHEAPDAQAGIVGDLLQDDRVRRVMEFAADLGTARQMGDLLTAERNSELAVAGLYELGRVFERHGTAEDSADWYATFAGRAGWVLGGTVPDNLRLRVVNALAGMARGVGRALSGSDGEKLRALNEAIPWTEDAERLCRGHEDEDSARAATHAKATRGFLLRKRAGLEPRDSASGLEFLLQAEKALREAYDERTRQFTNSPELDRSQFNLAGLEIRLAQRDRRSKRNAHLDEAWRHYTEVLETRRRRYRTDELEEVVCCIHGQAIALYYRAVLLPGSWAAKTTLLRDAASHAAEAVAIRQRLAGISDDSNTSKSLLLQSKISLTRLAVIEAAGKRADRDEAAIRAFREERRELIALPDEILPDGESEL